MILAFWMASDAIELPVYKKMTSKNVCTKKWMCGREGKGCWLFAVEMHTLTIVLSLHRLRLLSIGAAVIQLCSSKVSLCLLYCQFDKFSIKRAKQTAVLEVELLNRCIHFFLPILFCRCCRFALYMQELMNK